MKWLYLIGWSSFDLGPKLGPFTWSPAINFIRYHGIKAENAHFQPTRIHQRWVIFIPFTEWTLNWAFFRLHNRRYFISQTKSYNAFKFSTAACNVTDATLLALKGHLPTSNYYTLSSDVNLGCLCFNLYYIVTVLFLIFELNSYTHVVLQPFFIWLLFVINLFFHVERC